MAGGFDCSGFVWWVMKMQTYTAGGHTWSGDAAIGQLRTTYQMSQAVKLTSRVSRAGLHPGDILFWSSAPNGREVVRPKVVIDGSGDGVTVDYMGAGAGWYHDAFAFGWRIMPMHK